MQTKIGIQGHKGSFHEMAASKIYGPKIELEYLLTFEELFSAIENNEIKKGIVAVANFKS
jgi:prephenate dehydratase